jgi:Protein of unknown function (DUF2865)
LPEDSARRQRDLQQRRVVVLFCLERQQCPPSKRRNGAAVSSAFLRVAACALPFALAASAALAQALPPPPANSSPARSQACGRLEGQLAALDRGPPDARAEQIKRYEDAANNQQMELDRAVAQSRRLGCEGGSFFLFRTQNPQCDQLNAQVQRMRANLDRMLDGLQQLQGSGSDREEQRRGIMIALAQNDCGPQYRAAAAAPARSRGLFDSLFGAPDEGAGTPSEPPQAGGTFSTVCVRTCDGFYFPVSYATVPSRFPDDERACHRMCPAAEVALYAYRNPGENMSRAVSIGGKPYSELPNAFRYRQELNPACSCKRPNESWAEALQQTQDETIQRGDIVVTPDQAKQLSQPKAETPTKPAKPEPPRTRAKPATPQSADRQAAPPAPAEAKSPPPDAALSSSAPTPPSDKPRAVGPQFYR